MLGGKVDDFWVAAIQAAASKDKTTVVNLLLETKPSLKDYACTAYIQAKNLAQVAHMLSKGASARLAITELFEQDPDSAPEQAQTILAAVSAERHKAVKDVFDQSTEIHQECQPNLVACR